MTSLPSYCEIGTDGTGFCQKTRSYLPVALLVEIDEKAAQIDGKLVEIRNEFTLDEELVWRKTRLDEFFVL